MVKYRIAISSIFCASVVFCACACFAGLAYQDFEPDNGSDTYGWTWGASVVRLSNPGEPSHGGGRSWRAESTDYWNGTGIQSQSERWHFDALASRNDRLVFYVYALSSNGGDNNAGVQFFDHGNYSTAPFEVWTTRTARYGQWTELYVLFSQLPTDFNLGDIDKVQFIQYWPGTYYLDDIAVVRQDRVYQSFEPQLRSGSTVDEYGWKWNEQDSVGFSSAGEPVHEGHHSWKLVTTQRWGGTGLQSQEKRLLQTSQGNEQTFWHVDLNPAFNDRLIFWAYALPENGLDNNIGVQFYDHDKHATDEAKAVVWTKQAAVCGEWTRLEVLFSQLPQTLNLNDIDKIQLQVYWPGTYYFDDIRASAPLAKIKKGSLPQGLLEWGVVQDAGDYQVEESLQGRDGPWHLFWSSFDLNSWTTSVPLTSLSKAWYRIKWIEKDSVPALAYQSNWSDIVEYAPAPALLKNKSLKQNLLEWENLALAQEYEVQSAPEKNGPWSLIYKGTYPNFPLSARFGEWYRIRALNDISATDWSPGQMVQPQKGFIKAVGTVLKENDGFGNEIVLRGVNLGGCLLIENWMTGIGAADTPFIEDEWGIREVLAQRFTQAGAERLLSQYRNAYLNSFDFDRLLELGVNCVRLPFFYRVLQDAEGNWLKNDAGEIDFASIDRIVNACADRDIYVLLDLHGAPGAQSQEAHTGRAHYNKLFEESAEGKAYRQQTVYFWKTVAEHYKDTAAVVGYDLLNEPIGAAPQKEALWSLYDDIYRAIRAVDPNHLIVMEGIWYPDPTDPNKYVVDWDTLPRPSEKGWENVMYQFHYYLWDNNDNMPAHKAYIDLKVSEALIKQPEYKVPVMIGEFFGFSLKPIWEYYFENFTRLGWSWASWSYKYQYHPSEWGVYTNKDYDDELPKLREQEADGSAGDSEQGLAEKLAKFDTQRYHAPNVSLLKLLKKHLAIPLSLNHIGNYTTAESGSISFTVSAVYTGEGTLIYSANPLPKGATFANQRFSWTPGFDQAGTYSIDFTVTDGIFTDNEIAVITVVDVLPGIVSLSDSPDPFSPNNDNRKDTTTIRASFNHSISWSLDITNSAGVPVRNFAGKGARITQEWNGRNSGGKRLADGVYTYTVSGVDIGGGQAAQSGTVTIDTATPKLSNITISPDPFYPRRGKPAAISFNLSEPSYVTVSVYNRWGKFLKTLVQNQLVETSNYLAQWDGRSSSGNYVPAGIYTYKIWVQDKASNRISPYPTQKTSRVK